MMMSTNIQIIVINILNILIQKTWTKSCMRENEKIMNKSEPARKYELHVQTVMAAVKLKKIVHFAKGLERISAGVKRKRTLVQIVRAQGRGRIGVDAAAAPVIFNPAFPDETAILSTLASVPS
jgi:hypothetical protein